jgi:dTMP kinase
MRGVFITFEGIEGSGKSTQISKLAEHLKALNHPVRLTREPGGTAIGDQVRKILLDSANTMLVPRAELLLYAAARAQHLEELIRPALEAGSVVLCDRFSDATLAYQGYGRGLDIELIRALDRITTGGIKPDLTMLLDIGASAGISRARGRNSRDGLESEARFENEALAFHERVRTGYLALAGMEPGRYRVVDASLKPDEVQETIRRIVDGTLSELRWPGGTEQGSF